MARSSPAFLIRLARAAGLAAIPLVGFGDTGSQAEICVAVDESSECPGAEQALENFQPGKEWNDATDCAVIGVLGPGVREAASCCYDVQLEDCPTYDPGLIDRNPGCMGRPYSEAGRTVMAKARRGAARRPGASPRLDGLSPGQRRRLAAFWLRIGLAEHASSAEFHRVSLELMRHGAPAALLRRAQVAAIDETRHAARCFALSSAYAGEPVEAGALPLDATVSLARLAVKLM